MGRAKSLLLALLLRLFPMVSLLCTLPLHIGSLCPMWGVYLGRGRARTGSGGLGSWRGSGDDECGGGVELAVKRPR